MIGQLAADVQSAAESEDDAEAAAGAGAVVCANADVAESAVTVLMATAESLRIIGFSS